MINTLKPSISVDCVVFKFDMESSKLLVLLVQRKAVLKGESPISLPGDEVNGSELMLEAAKRVLHEQTQLEIPLYRYRSFEDPNRLNRPVDEGKRVITKAYLGFVHEQEPIFGGLAASGDFVALESVPKKMLYDHRDIFDAALVALKRATENHLLPLDGLPETFTITQVQQLYEAILDQPLDKRNFRRSILAKNYLTETGKMMSGQSFRPAKLYAFSPIRFQNCLDKELEKLPVVLF